MTSSLTFTQSDTFTITHARHMAAKVATDLKRVQRFYGSPSDDDIADYEAELIEFLKVGAVAVVTYGFRRHGDWIEPMLRYTAHDLAGAAANDDDPGKVRPGADITGAVFYSYLSYSPAWNQLSEQQREAVRVRLPFRRGGASEPGINGHLTPDRTYSAGGRALQRQSLRSF